MVRFRDSTITQRAAFFRILYGLSFMFLTPFIRILGFDTFQVPTFLILFPFQLLTMTSMQFLFTLNGQPLVKDPSFSNWRWSIMFLLIGKQFFEPSPHSNKDSYRMFRGLLGVFTLVLGSLIFLLILPLVAIELVTSRGNSVRQSGPYTHFNSNEGNEATVR